MPGRSRGLVRLHAAIPGVANGVTIAFAGPESGDGMRAVIAGAGTTGLYTAIALARRGHWPRCGGADPAGT
jgi:threonine dehydrogenase-like Zn-dependent dehydrogenase